MLQGKTTRQSSTLAAAAATLLACEVSKADLSSNTLPSFPQRNKATEYQQNLRSYGEAEPLTKEFREWCSSLKEFIPYEIVRIKNEGGPYSSRAVKALENLEAELETPNKAKVERGYKSYLEHTQCIANAESGLKVVGLAGLLGVSSIAALFPLSRFRRKVEDLIDSAAFTSSSERRFLHYTLNKPSHFAGRLSSSLNVLCYLGTINANDKAEWMYYFHKVKVVTLTTACSIGAIGLGYASGSIKAADLSPYAGLIIFGFALNILANAASETVRSQRGEKLARAYREWRKTSDL